MRYKLFWIVWAIVLAHKCFASIFGREPFRVFSIPQDNDVCFADWSSKIFQVCSLYWNWRVDRTFASSKTTAFGFWLGWIVKHIWGKDALIVWAIGSWISSFIDRSSNCIAFESFSSTYWLGFDLFVASNSNKWNSWRNPMYVHGEKKLLFNFWGNVVRRHFWSGMQNWRKCWNI